MIPARRAYGALLLLSVLGVAASALGGVAAVPGTAIALTGTDLILLGLLVVDSWRVRAHRVTIERHMDDRLSIGRTNTITLTVTTGDRPSVLQIRDSYPPNFAATPADFEVSLPAHSRHTLTYTVFPPARGDYQWGNIFMRQLGSQGLSWHRWSVPQAKTVAVFPDLIGLRSLSIRLTLQASGTIRRTRRQGMGTEFAELRDYNTGDDPRLIDWKATARRNRPLVRVLEPEQEQTLLILLDRGRLMTAMVEGIQRFDWGVNAALSLALAAIRRGDRVGLGVFDREMHCWVPPDRGSAQLPRLLTRLTPLKPVLLEPDYVEAVSFVTRQQTRRSLVVLLTDIIDKTASSEVLAAMARLSPRYLPFCVALRDPLIDRQAQRVSDQIEAAYERAVALDVLNQRQIALETLKQQGVLILDAPANQLSDLLVERYLMLKARSQL